MHVGLQAARQRRLYGHESVGLGIKKKIKNYNKRKKNKLKCQVKRTLGAVWAEFLFLLFMGAFASTVEGRKQNGGKKGGDVKINQLSTTLIPDAVTLQQISCNFFRTLHPTIQRLNSLLRTR